MNATLLPTPTMIVRDDGLVLWQYNWPTESVTVEAVDKATADAKMQAYFDALATPKVVPPDPIATVFAALPVLDPKTATTVDLGNAVNAVRDALSSVLAATAKL